MAVGVEAEQVAEGLDGDNGAGERGFSEVNVAITVQSAVITPVVYVVPDNVPPHPVTVSM